MIDINSITHFDEVLSLLADKLVSDAENFIAELFIRTYKWANTDDFLKWETNGFLDSIDKTGVQTNPLSDWLDKLERLRKASGLLKRRPIYKFFSYRDITEAILYKLGAYNDR